MPTRVRFRFNRRTGEVVELLVDDQDRTLPEAEHDRIAGEVGRVLSRHPVVSEVVPGAVPRPEPIPQEPIAGEPEGEPAREPEHRRQESS